MDFAWSETQTALYDRTLAFAQTLGGDIRTRDREHAFSRAEWQRCGEFGLLGLSVPEAFGGMGLGALSTARAVEAFGRGCRDTGLVFAAAAHLFACVMPIFDHGDDALRRRLLPALCSGERIGANAITEAEAGSDVHALKTTARRDGDGYVLDGTKSYVTNAEVADVFVVYATTNPAHGYLGLSAFVVERGAPGLVIGKPFDKIGLTTTSISSIYLDGCRVRDADRLGAEGQGAIVFRSSMEWERACLFAAYVGVMERQLEQVVEHARTRRQFGKPIGHNQAVSHKIADMKLRLESARLLLYRACWARDQGQDATAAISMAKLAVSEAAVQNGLDAIQLHGGSGVLREYDVERMLRDAVPSTIFSGTSELQRTLIAKSLGL
ncbi:MAG TPA: acyl-CoA dehydrogenase family protein [Kofleriaceae bacterium]|nr:acyl-CoA dehydrogenase family protein [Kofleriaceae bacterium]